MLSKVFKTAKSIRNSYSHQDFDINRFEHDVECLEKIATFIGAENVAEEIHKFIFKTSMKAKVDGNSWLQLKELGNAHYRNKEWTDSMNCFTNAIRLNKTEPLLYSNRAMCEFNLRKFQLALEDIEYAISLDPKVLDTLVTLF